ncbi:tRNA-dihydrouridine synthase [Pseudidiomarina aquimaris]|uniref:tRNA-dihydrouridine synthase n=1 Tax=Pseudidiomarina aquimaris TaxID=641841 RepID=UPI003A97B05C
MKQRYPGYISINDGIQDGDEIKHHLEYVDGVAIGREAYQNPVLLTQFDGLFGEQHELNIEHVLEEMISTDAHVLTGGVLARTAPYDWAFSRRAWCQKVASYCQQGPTVVRVAS